MRKLILISLVLAGVANAQQDEAAQAARFKGEAMLCAAFYARTAYTAERGSDLAKIAERNAQLYLETTRAAGATTDYIEGAMATYTLLVSRAFVTPEAQLELLDQCEAIMNGPPR
jgi:hypothetical protein